MKLECNFFAGSARILNEETVMDVIREHAKEPVSTFACYPKDETNGIIKKSKALSLLYVSANCLYKALEILILQLILNYFVSQYQDFCLMVLKLEEITFRKMCYFPFFS